MPIYKLERRQVAANDGRPDLAAMDADITVEAFEDDTFDGLSPEDRQMFEFEERLNASWPPETN